MKSLFTAHPPQRYIQQRDNIITPINPTGRREWIIARSILHYRLFKLHDIPPARQEEALNHQIRQWSPFTQTADYRVWRKNHVQVWIWDAVQQQEKMTAANLKITRCIPETVLRPHLTTDGAQLLTCTEGYEGQIWQAQILRGSRWWAQPPNLKQWHLFERAQGLSPSPELPQPIESQLLIQAWGKPRFLLGGFNWRQERPWVTLGLATFAAILTAQTMQLWQWQTAIKQIQTQIDALNQGAAPILQARNQAVDDRLRAQHLANLDPFPSQLALMAHIAEKLPRNGAKLLEWNYQTGDLRFTVEAPDIDPRWYVQTFQNMPIFFDVKSESGRTANQIIMQMRVTATTTK